MENTERIETSVFSMPEIDLTELNEPQLVSHALLLSEIGIEFGDFGPIVEKCLRDLMRPSDPRQKAAELTVLFNLIREEACYHPLIEEYLSKLTEEHGYSPTEFASAATREKKVCNDWRKETGIHQAGLGYSAGDIIAHFQDPQRLAHFSIVFKRWISQALIYADNAHSYTFGDQHRARAFLELMISSRFFYDKMLSLAMITAKNISANVPPIDVFSSDSYVIPLNIIKRAFLIGGDTAVRKLWRKRFLQEKILAGFGRIQTTGIGRIRPLADRFAEILQAKLLLGGKLFDNQGRHEAEIGDTIRILNLGGGLLQTPDLIAALRQKGLPIDSKHIILDIQNLPELVQKVSAYYFVRQPDGSLIPAQNLSLNRTDALAVSHVLAPGFLDNQIAIDCGSPFPAEMVIKIFQTQPNVVISTNTIKPHFTSKQEFQVYVNILSSVKTPIYLLHLYGGYIGSPELIAGITALVTVNENNEIRIFPIDIHIKDGWISMEGVQTIKNIGGSLLQSTTIPTISPQAKPCFHTDRLPSSDDQNTTSQEILSDHDIADTTLILNSTETFKLFLGSHKTTKNPETAEAWQIIFKEIYNNWIQREPTRSNKISWQQALELFEKHFFLCFLKKEAVEHIATEHQNIAGSLINFAGRLLLFRNS